MSAPYCPLNKNIITASMDPMKRILSALLFAFVTVTATAQEQDQERPDRWYEVEVLVFEQRNANSSEELPELPGKINTEGAVELVKAAGAASGQPVAYQILPPENYRLRAAFNKLGNSGKYQPLFHAAWRQSVPPRERADRIHLTGKGVDGIITVGISRYLHVTTDLLVQKTTEAGSRFHLEGALRMRSGEVHYIDHPLGGMLMVFTPYNP
jgi:hypothetical protein